MFDGFEAARFQSSEAETFYRVGGPVSAPPVLLIHGYPQCHVIWRHIAPKLAATYRVICPDLRGYGDSTCPPTDADHAPYSKRAMGEDLFQLMTHLGHEDFHIVGHDRGARVTYRMALDAPDRVKTMTSLDVVPTGAMWASANKAWGLGSFHWLFLAQPAPHPETLIGRDPDYWMDWLVSSWSASMDGFPDDIMEIYKTHFRKPEVIHATCEEYRAGAGIDDALDQADLAAGKKVECPLMVLWGAGRNTGGPGKGVTKTPLDIWRDWAEDVRGEGLPCGHFLPEEEPDGVYDRVLAFLAEHP